MCVHILYRYTLGGLGTCASNELELAGSGKVNGVAIAGTTEATEGKC